MGFYNDRSEYNERNAEMGKLGEQLVLRLDSSIYKNDPNIIVYYTNQESDSKKIGDILIYDIKNDFLQVKEVECRSKKDFTSLQKYYLLAYNLMSQELASIFDNVKMYPTGINVPDKSFYSLKNTTYQIPDPNNPETFIVDRLLTKKEISSALYVIVNEDDLSLDFPNNMIEIKINKIINSTSDVSDNVRQSDEQFYKIGYTVADYISIEEGTNEKFYHAD